MVHRIFGLMNRALGTRTAYAHCDIPCGIYDPHGAQLAAQTVVRMVQLIEGLQPPAPDAGQAAMDAFANTITRYVAVKEQHAELAKKELQILWSDYFKPEHLEKYPDLHTKFWNALKLGGRNKQAVDAKAAQELLAATQDIAEIFWATKGVQTKRQPSNQPVGGETVVPVA